METIPFDSYTLFYNSTMTKDNIAQTQSSDGENLSNPSKYMSSIYQGDKSRIMLYKLISLLWQEFTKFGSTLIYLCNMEDGWNYISSGAFWLEKLNTAALSGEFVTLSKLCFSYFCWPTTGGIAPATVTAAELSKMYRRDGYGKECLCCYFFMDMYAKCGSMESARSVFDGMPEKDIVSWTVMIGGYASNGLPKEAVDLFFQTKRENVKPDCFTMVGILSACARLGALELGDWMEKMGVRPDGNTFIELLFGYTHASLVEDGRRYSIA
ncbi:hypothetical protein HHK36_018785 [Tetracentron sinense]|uniref:Pentatricopeptide repeat-containing protein n=1 Tax=Tetracentron sinense TaxID=13715 RepID=A0A835D8K1_TETSI|nr:hypothetical protein HHK36_018785 [Tetracentron sinense]